MNNFILLLGSNIDPEKNLNAAIDLLGNIRSQSQIWKTRAFGSDGPDFLNLAVEVLSTLDKNNYKETVITNIEHQLNRVRSSNKYAPRTIDIDIIVFNNIVVDSDLWEKAFVAIPVSELRPNLISPKNKKLIDIAKNLKSSADAELFMSTG